MKHRMRYLYLLSLLLLYTTGAWGGGTVTVITQVEGAVSAVGGQVTKEVTDGNVRKDFPGGFPRDTHDCFTKEGRSKAEQSMFQWLSRLLHWRQNNEVITKGKQIQFIPYNGIYVIARQYQGRTALTILNGINKAATLDVGRYQEVIGNAGKVKDILTNRYFDLSKDFELKPRQSLILEF